MPTFILFQGGLSLKEHSEQLSVPMKVVERKRITTPVAPFLHRPWSSFKVSVIQKSTFSTHGAKTNESNNKSSAFKRPEGEKHVPRRQTHTLTHTNTRTSAALDLCTDELSDLTLRTRLSRLCPTGRTYIVPPVCYWNTGLSSIQGCTLH